MSVPWESLTGFAGPAGIGAICILAAFLFLDGQNPNLFPSVEFYAKTSTWSIVAAIPLLASSYFYCIWGLTRFNHLCDILFRDGGYHRGDCHGTTIRVASG